MSKRILMWTLTTFVLTLMLGTLLPMKWLLGLAIFVLIGIVPVLLIRISAKKLILCCQAALLVAVMLFTASEYIVDRKRSVLIGEEKPVSGEIVDVGTNAAGNLTCYKIKLTEIDGEKLSFYETFYINLYCDGGETHLPGARVQGTVAFFDTAIEYGAGREDRIFLSGYQVVSKLQFDEPIEKSVSRTLYQFRDAVQSRLSFGKEETKGLLRSVCLGDTDSLKSGLNVSLRRIGLTHVTSVSGLHLSFTVLLFNFLFMILGIHYRARYVLDIFISIFFTAVVGFPLSCIRACVMMILFSLGMALNLFSDSLTSLSVAAFLITVFNPYAIRDVGFLLSVSATVGIILLSLPLENFLFPKKLCQKHWINWGYRKLTGAFACSIAATITTLPIILFVFGSVSLIGPLANTVLIYPLQWVFMMGILMILLGWVPGVGVVLGFLCDVLYSFIDIVSDFFGRFSFASVSGFNLCGIILLVLLVGIIVVGLYDFYRHQRRSFIALFLLLLCFFGAYHGIYAATHPADAVEIAFIDVGQGDCTVISKDHSAVILDYGGSSNKRYQLLKYLQKRNIYAVELLAFTHLHSDHTNGLRTLLKNVYVDEIIYPDLGFESNEMMSMVQSENADPILENSVRTVLGDVQLEIIADAVFDQSLSGENERCVCYRISYGDTSVLVTGDLSGTAELKLTDRDLDCTLLKVAHHGSASSSLYPFIRAASPEISVLSVGENSYGLPKTEVLERLETVSPVVLQTLNEGTIIFRTDGITMERVLK